MNFYFLNSMIKLFGVWVGARAVLFFLKVTNNHKWVMIFHDDIGVVFFVPKKSID